MHTSLHAVKRSGSLGAAGRGRGVSHLPQRRANRWQQQLAVSSQTKLCHGWVRKRLIHSTLTHILFVSLNGFLCGWHHFTFYDPSESEKTNLFFSHKTYGYTKLKAMHVTSIHHCHLCRHWCYGRRSQHNIPIRPSRKENLPTPFFTWHDNAWAGAA